jgi:hypothetical protein
MSHPSAIVFRNLLHTLGAVLAVSLLFYPMPSFAATTPTYFACVKTTNQFGVVSCSGQYSIITGSAPNSTLYFSSLIGNVNTTAISGTQAAYLVCTKFTNQFGVTSCSGHYSIIAGSTPNPSTYFSQLIGYPYTSAVAGTSVTYLACTLVTNTFGVTSCSGQYEIIQGITPNSSIYQSWLIGYVNP